MFITKNTVFRSKLQFHILRNMRTPGGESSITPKLLTVFLFHKITSHSEATYRARAAAAAAPPPHLLCDRCLLADAAGACRPSEHDPLCNHADTAGGNPLQHHRAPPMPQFKIPFTQTFITVLPPKPILPSLPIQMSDPFFLQVNTRGAMSVNVQVYLFSIVLSFPPCLQLSPTVPSHSLSSACCFLFHSRPPQPPPCCASLHQQGHGMYSRLCFQRRRCRDNQQVIFVSFRTLASTALSSFTRSSLCEPASRCPLLR